MNRAVNRFDNALMETCLGTLKAELKMTEYIDHRPTVESINAYLVSYHTQRKHSTLGYLGPLQIEAEITKRK